jgi:hypothetical protein
VRPIAESAVLYLVLGALISTLSTWLVSGGLPLRWDRHVTSSIDNNKLAGDLYRLILFSSVHSRFGERVELIRVTTPFVSIGTDLGAAESAAGASHRRLEVLTELWGKPAATLFADGRGLAWDGPSTHDRWGWPFRGLAQEWDLVERRLPDGSLEPMYVAEWGIPIRGTSGWDSAGDLRGLPLRPLFPGFVLNAVVFGAFAWVGWQTWLAVRGRVRMRRGKCATCGYDLVGVVGPGCPECGWGRA